jgi:hypothetical protein
VALSADTTFYWPELASGSSLMADIMEVTPTAAWSMTFPAANAVSTGRDVLVRNLGAFTVTLKDQGGGTIGTVAAGVAKYLYITDNSSANGVWTVFTFGTGTSAADAAALAGYGMTAIGSQLAQTAVTTISSIAKTLVDADRAKTFAFTNSGTVACTFPGFASVANGWFVNISNQGTGTVTLTMAGGETIDGASTKALAPGESCTVVSAGTTNWASIGYGRSTAFQFTKLVLDVSGGAATFTLTSTQAGNKLMNFIGTITGNVIVTIPAVVGIYYVQNNFTGAFTVEFKTVAGTGIAMTNTDNVILYCDGVNVVNAQTSSLPTANLSGGAAGQLVYQVGGSSTGFSAAGTAGQVAISGGTGAPTFSSNLTVVGGNVAVSGGTFVSRGITDNATATALTLSGSGANSVTIANSATNPTIGTSAGGLAIAGNVNEPSCYATGNINGAYPSSAKGLAVANNFLLGNLEVDYFNTETTAVVSYAFYQKTGASAATQLLLMYPDGKVLATSKGGLGYGIDAGGAVIQITSRVTGVTLNTPTGAITMFSAAGSATWSSFVVTNSTVAVGDTVVLSAQNGATDLYLLQAHNIANGSFDIGFATTGGTAIDAPVINFTIIKGSAS